MDDRNGTRNETVTTKIAKNLLIDFLPHSWVRVRIRVRVRVRVRVGVGVRARTRVRIRVSGKARVRG
jgi:hypothetical protein